MDPLATYSDKSHFGRRSYRLFTDRLQVTHNDTLHSESETTLRLLELDPNYVRIAARSAFFSSGLWMTIVPWTIYWALIELTRTDPFAMFAGSFLALGFAGLFMFVVGLRKQRYVCFRTLAGVPALTIFKGPRRAEFDTFVSTLVGAIESTKQTSD
jgi:hypothetical protein